MLKFIKAIGHFLGRYPVLTITLSWLLVMWLLITLGGCSRKKIIEKANYQTTARTDTVYIGKTEILKDTTFIIKRDSSLIKALVKCDKKGRAYLSEIIELRTGNRIRTIIKQNYDTLFIRSTIDSAAVYFTWKETHEKEFKQTTTKSTTLETQKTTKKIFTLPVWAWILIIILGAWLIFKYVWPWIRKFLIGL